MKKWMCLCLFTLISLNTQAQEKVVTDQKLSEAKEDSDRALLPSNCITVLDRDGAVSCWTSFTNRVNVGPGISTVTIGFDGNIGLMDQITPVELSFNFMQFIGVKRIAGRDEFSKYVLWRAAIGFIITKDSEEDLAIGLTLTPYSIKINDFSVGIGVGYKSTSNKVTAKNENFFISIPLTYKINF